MSSEITALKSNALPLIIGSFTVAKKEGNRTFTITPDCLCAHKAARFLALYYYYREDRPPGGEQEVNKTIKNLCERFLAGQPFSGYLIQEGKNVVGHWVMDYTEKPGCLSLGLAIAEHRKGIATGVWKWTVERLLPELHAKGFQIPVFEKGKIVKYVPIPAGSFCAMSQKDNQVLPQLLTRAGFRLIQENVGTIFGKRDLYEARIAGLLPSSKQ